MRPLYCYKENNLFLSPNKQIFVTKKKEKQNKTAKINFVSLPLPLIVQNIHLISCDQVNLVYIQRSVLTHTKSDTSSLSYHLCGL